MVILRSTLMSINEKDKTFFDDSVKGIHGALNGVEVADWLGAWNLHRL